MRRWFLIALFVLLMAAYSFALECGSETIPSRDCNVTVVAPATTTACDLNLFHPSGIPKELNTVMTATPYNSWFYQFNDSNRGDYLFHISCTDGSARAFAGGVFSIVDSNVASYVDTLEAGQVTITGNQAALSTDLDDINTTVRDANKLIGDVNVIVGGIDSNVNVDLNIDLYSASGLTAAAVWANPTRTLTDYNQNALYTLAIDTNKMLGSIIAGDLNVSIDVNAIWNYPTSKEGLNILKLIEEIFTILTTIGFI